MEKRIIDVPRIKTSIPSISLVSIAKTDQEDYYSPIDSNASTSRSNAKAAMIKSMFAFMVVGVFGFCSSISVVESVVGMVISI